MFPFLPGDVDVALWGRFAERGARGGGSCISFSIMGATSMDCSLLGEIKGASSLPVNFSLEGSGPCERSLCRGVAEEARPVVGGGAGVHLTGVEDLPRSFLLLDWFLEEVSRVSPMLPLGSGEAATGESFLLWYRVMEDASGGGLLLLAGIAGIVEVCASNGFAGLISIAESLGSVSGADASSRRSISS